MNRKILIVEDDSSFGVMLRNWLGKRGFEGKLCSGIEQAKKELLQCTFRLIFTDLRLPDGDGIMLLAWIKEQKIDAPVIIMTSYAEIQSAVSAMRLGAFDYLEKPINPSVLTQKIEQALEFQSVKPTENVRKIRPKNEEGIVYGKSRAAHEMYEYIQIVAPTRMSVLITGESGTGKEYAARLIHQTSRRKEAPFFALDCGSLSRELAPSELFGHLKGSFTSAISDKKGVFELADGGTVFLDEVGNLGYDVQVQLLRALQELKIRPVGSATDIKVDVRIIVATNEDLKAAIAEGRFREDLYHRLNEFSFTVPPLRERISDIPYFVSHFLERANEELEKEVKSISEETLALLKQYQWSGNLRELRNVVRRAVLFAKTDQIVPENLPDFLLAPLAGDDLSLFVGDEKEKIEAALKRARGNKAAAARLLKIDRKTLYNRMHQLGMDLNQE